MDRTMNIKSISGDLFVIAIGALAACLVFYFLAPDAKEQISYSAEISDKRFQIEQLKKQPELDPLVENWDKAELIASYFNLDLKSEPQEQLNGFVPATQPAFFGRIEGKSSQDVLNLAWALSRSLPVIIQKGTITPSSTILSIAVLGKDSQ